MEWPPRAQRWWASSIGFQPCSLYTKVSRLFKYFEDIMNCRQDYFLLFEEHFSKIVLLFLDTFFCRLVNCCSSFLRRNVAALKCIFILSPSTDLLPNCQITSFVARYSSSSFLFIPLTFTTLYCPCPDFLDMCYYHEIYHFKISPYLVFLTFDTHHCVFCTLICTQAHYTSRCMSNWLGRRDSDGLALELIGSERAKWRHIDAGVALMHDSTWQLLRMLGHRGLSIKSNYCKRWRRKLI